MRDLFLQPALSVDYLENSSKSRVGRAVSRGPNITESWLPLPEDCLLAGLSSQHRFDLAWLTSAKRPYAVQKERPLTIVDLFSGCGGLTLGIEDACASIGRALRSQFACDLDEVALEVYRKNFEPPLVSSASIDEIFRTDFAAPLSDSEKELQQQLGEIDFLVGGPPCQGHSDLNNHTRRSDPRNDLYTIMGRAARVLNPRYIVIENVPGVQHSKSGVVSATLGYLKTLGYNVESFVLNAADFGVAQNRKRHFSVGTRGTTQRTGMLLDRLRCPAFGVMSVIGDLGELNDSPFDSSATHSPENNRRIQFLFEHDFYELPDEERPDCHRLKPHSYKSVYGRMRPDSPSPTITSGFGSTGQGRFVHPLEPRTITPHEAARIQHFPDWFSFGDLGRRQLQKVIGNAVPSRLGYVLGMLLLDSDTEY
jgi:DNA (cytosine-5)-methyltransferase 1